MVWLSKSKELVCYWLVALAVCETQLCVGLTMDVCLVVCKFVVPLFLVEIMASAGVAVVLTD